MFDNFFLDVGGKIFGGGFKDLKHAKQESEEFMKDVEKNPEKYFGKPEDISGGSNSKFPPIK